MNKTQIFLVLIILGAFGRWVLMPSVAKLKYKQAQEREANKEFKIISCLDKGSCSLTELQNGRILYSKNTSKYRDYLLKNSERFIKENRGLYFKTRAMFIRSVDIDKALHKSLKKDDLISFSRGLFSCHLSFCRDYFTKYESDFEKLESRIDFLKLKIKQEGAWRYKDKYLKEYLQIVVEKNLFDEVIQVMEFVPNHQVLKIFLVKNYLKFKSLNSITDVAVHLSRYHNAWHILKYKEIADSNSAKHIKQFISTMMIGCPSNYKKIFSYFEGHKDYYKYLQSQARYHFKEVFELPDYLRNEVKNYRKIENSKCFRP